MMKLPTLLRSVKQPFTRYLAPSSVNASYSTLQKVKWNENVIENSKVTQPKPNDMLTASGSSTMQVHSMLLQQIVNEQQKLNDLITSIKSLQVNNDKKDDGISPSVIGDQGGYQALNRSARHPRRANRGKRPVSRQARRAKKRRWGNHRR